PELVEKLGVKRTIINQAAGKMVREGLLVVDGYTDKITHYRKLTEKERLELAQRAEWQQEPSVIEACKRSEIMKRILFIYGAGEELPVI
ncbi:MarR family transcriptional regulator, partial [Escherichia coli]|nr:MarR family transcriptional regulator [Escherichia coli]EET8038701.1 MarR family transcriptional regulator [Escherichia coli]EEV3414190.1 MarR family transcriptional regulator [Escherichia coli]EHW5716973.1 MarR family transcriptional regulator [Escherichia coli]EJF6596741.1 MarR family transcriptional regulator [Escherichia coli]